MKYRKIKVGAVIINIGNIAVLPISVGSSDVGIATPVALQLFNKIRKIYILKLCWEELLSNVVKSFCTVMLASLLCFSMYVAKGFVF